MIWELLRISDLSRDVRVWLSDTKVFQESNFIANNMTQAVLFGASDTAVSVSNFGRHFALASAKNRRVTTITEDTDPNQWVIRL